MKNINNLEIIKVYVKDGATTALLSFQNADNLGDINNGYNTIEVPISIRKVKYSERGNVLCDQSIKDDKTVKTTLK